MITYYYGNSHLSLFNCANENPEAGRENLIPRRPRRTVPYPHTLVLLHTLVLKQTEWKRRLDAPGDKTRHLIYYPFLSRRQERGRAGGRCHPGANKDSYTVLIIFYGFVWYSLWLIYCKDQIPVIAIVYDLLIQWPLLWHYFRSQIPKIYERRYDQSIELQDLWCRIFVMFIH